MDDAVGVEVAQPAEHLEQHAREHALGQAERRHRRRARRQRLVRAEEVVERAAVAVAEREVDVAVEVEGVVQRHDVLVVERAQHVQLVEHLVALPLVGDVDDLERDRLAARAVAREPHGAARAGAERLQRLELLERERRHLALPHRRLHDPGRLDLEAALRERAGVAQHERRRRRKVRREREADRPALFGRHGGGTVPRRRGLGSDARRRQRRPRSAPTQFSAQ